MKKILLGVVSIIILTSIVSQIYFIIETKNDLMNNLENKGEILSELASFSLEDGIWNYDTDYIENNVTAIMTDPYVAYVKVTDSENKDIHSKGNDSANFIKFNKKITKDSKHIGNVTIGLTTKYIDNNIRKLIIEQIITIIIQILIISILIYFFMKIITKPIHSLQKIASSLTIGDVNCDIEKIPNDEIGQLALSFKAMIKSIKEQAEFAEKLAEGDMNNEIIPRSENDILGISMKSVSNTLKLLVDETSYLTSAGINGDWNTRGNSSKFSGGYKDIINGINSTIDSIIMPIKESLEVLDEFSNGNLNVYVKGNYNGDHSKLKNTLNTAISSIKVYTDEIEYILNQISKGNLNVSITNDYYGNYIKIKDSLNLIIDSLNKAFQNIYESTNYVTAGAKEVSNGSQLLAENTNIQTDVVEKISSRISDIKAQAIQNTEKAKDSKNLANTEKQSADMVNNKMKLLLNAVNEIGNTSKNISKIIKVIDDISFQTNILALNAAIEAAKAGIYGKGFAVVANEVRTLSIKSSKAAKETAEHIEESINKINIGSNLSEETASTMNEILKIVSDTLELANDISFASDEQSSKIIQINKNIDQLNTSIQSNSSTAAESAATSQELLSQTESLNNILLQFKFKDTPLKIKS
jgi:methyl-accepting chemotaxis protein